MPVEVPTVLSLIGGSPILKSSGVYAEFLKVAKSIDGGGLGGLSGILNQVVANGNLTSVLQNPIAAITSTLQSTITTSISSLTAALGGAAAPLTSALGTLSTSSGGLLGGVDNLIGLGSSPLGFLDVVNHAGLLEAFGGSIPSQFSLGDVTAPITSGGLLSSVDSAVGAITSDVIGGSMTVGDATTAVNGYDATISGLVPASTAALAALQTHLVNISMTSALAGMTVAPPPGIEPLMPLIVQPVVLAQMTAIAEEAAS